MPTSPLPLPIKPILCLPFKTSLPIKVFRVTRDKPLLTLQRIQSALEPSRSQLRGKKAVIRGFSGVERLGVGSEKGFETGGLGSG